MGAREDWARVPGPRGTADVSLEDAERIARHLIGEPATGAEAERWVAAVRRRGVALGRSRDARLWAIAMRRPWLIGIADAGLALADPHSPVRHRLFLMLAVLEASPHHCRRFLPAPYPRAALAGLALRGLVAGLRAAAGYALVRTHGVLWR